MRYNTLIVAALVSLIIGACSSNKPSAQLTDLLNRIHNATVIRLDTINTMFIEYAPSVSSDGKRLYFISNRFGSIKLPNPDDKPERNFPSHDIWYCNILDYAQNKYSTPENADKSQIFDLRGLNTSLNEGTACYCTATRELFFTGCSRPDGYGDCDLYVCMQSPNGTWSLPENLGPEVNSSSWDSQPSISADGMTLYFASNRIVPSPYKSGGEINIWFSTYDTLKHRWNSSVPLERANIGAKNWAPFICPDGKTLFFSSMLVLYPEYGLDFFVTERDSTGSWSKPINVGEPLNTKKDDFFLSVSSAMNVVYFSRLDKDEKTGLLNYDLYKLVLPAKSNANDKFRLP